MPQREPLDIDEEQRLVAEDEVPLAPAEPCVGVPEVPSGVVGVPAAPCWEVGAVDSGGLYEARHREGLALPQPRAGGGGSRLPQVRHTHH